MGGATQCSSVSPRLHIQGLRQQAATFEEKDEILYHSSTDLEAGIKRLRRVVVDEQEQKDLFTLVMMVLMADITAEIKH